MATKTAKHTGWWIADAGVHQRWYGGRLLTLKRVNHGWWLLGLESEAVIAGWTLPEAKTNANRLASERLS